MRTGCAHVDEAERMGYIVKVNKLGKGVIYPAYLYRGRWWDVQVVSSRYKVLVPHEIASDVPIWETPELAQTGLVALAMER